MRNGLDGQGCDYEPVFWKKTVIELVKEGSLSMERLDDIVSRVLRVKMDLGLFENPYTDENAWENVIRCEKHRDIAYETAKESVVLLKNNGVLPLKKDISSIALIGPSSAAQKIGGYSSVPQFHVPSVFEELKEALGEGVTVRQCSGCAITPGQDGPRIVDGQPHLYSLGEEALADEIDEALAIADRIVILDDHSVKKGYPIVSAWRANATAEDRHALRQAILSSIETTKNEKET